MKKANSLFGSFRLRITILFILLMFLSGIVSNFLVYDYALKSQMKQLREKLMVVAQMIALNIDTNSLLEIPLNEKGVNTAQYKKIESELMEIRSVSPSIAYIYVLAKTGKECVFKFMIDLRPGRYTSDNPPAKPGEEYNCSLVPEMMRAFTAPSADTKLVKDKWGVFLSGYAPIRDDAGNSIAILGIDMTAADLYNMQKEVNVRAALVLGLGIILSIIVGIFISGTVTKPVKKLIQGTRHISAGELSYRVAAKGSNEIRELAESFNRMASKLSLARKELLGYFYRVVQSLIRLLEAKDPSTKGHSDRVAEYAEKIARKLDMDEDRIELLKEAALLHDIGKVGIQDTLLHKNTALSDEERGELRKHPLIGEEILRPVSPDKEIVNAVKHHHERYDGSGYPDKLKGDQISILAAIVGVADSYDAMTSHRAYMKNHSKEEAIEQLRRNSGTQFNPKVVDAFIDILEKEK
ncbi:MAG: HD domain-containing protein [Candidatus Omnitrophota bacterium]|nr:HD domain-containing protein [Candidatus Omnitrophota bacterium]